ncbi:MAG: flagellar hook-length control protein FliK [Roseburia sp.]|nr:flagellar hook-length control protein FliK [Roseburia sp.]
MNLKNIFQPQTNQVKQAESPQTNGAVSVGERNYRILSEMKNLALGQTVQGEVVGKDGNTVQIALDADTILTARLEKELNIALGQSMSFEVKANNGSFLSLTPLYANMAGEATILKALSAAGLPETLDNMKMVAAMMKEGMPIDRDSIAYVNRQLVDFPGADPSSIMQMIRLGLPVTESNIEQFALYKNYEHQIIESAAQIMEEIPQTYQELLAEGRDMDAVSFYENILKALLEGESAEGIKETATEAAGENGLPGEPADITGKENITGGKLPSDMAASAQNEVAKSGAGDAAAAAPAEEIVKKEAAETERPLLSKEAWSKLGDVLQKMGADAETAAEISKGNLSPRAVLSQVNELLAEHSHVIREGFQESVKELFGSRTFQTLLRNEMSGQWLIKPEEVADKENVERLYERIREQTTKISEAFQMVDKGDAAGAKSVQNLQNNVDFMNQMNHLFTYVQLPLKMAGNQAHGDLYVYTNKKSLANKDGNVSALLHLDMEHLGPLDVYVAMQKSQNKVSTNFTLKDEEALDLVASHIHILDERLEKRGYSMNANFQLKDENEPETNMMQKILEQNKNISVLSRTSFDMRA